MAWTKQQIRELYSLQLQEINYAVRHSDPPTSGGINAPNVTVSQRELERREQCRKS